jgi:hypothetical protein
MSDLQSYLEEAKALTKSILPAGGGYYGSALPVRFEIAMQVMILQRLEKLTEVLGGLAGATPIAEEKAAPADQPAPNKVDKPCEKCGAMMIGVFPTRKYCDECKGAK